VSPELHDRVVVGLESERQLWVLKAAKVPAIALQETLNRDLTAAILGQLGRADKVLGVIVMKSDVDKLLRALRGRNALYSKGGLQGSSRKLLAA
jgi:hypothetical protein